jgi:glycosyltransferase involved in cell wall biosynthesis
MKTSALIPTYNSARTIEATLDAVFAQTIAPDEVLIMDDGSTDNTVSLLSRYVPRITLLQQRNGGVARARNVLAELAKGDLLAFLDHDDIWHPEYIATQQKSFREHGNAVGFFTAHANLVGFGGFDWNDGVSDTNGSIEVIVPLHFMQQYHKAIGKYASMSFCCIPKSVIRKLGPEPFHPEVSGVDDYFLFHTLMLLGPIVYNSRPLVAYRITRGAQSANLLKLVQKAVRALELLKPQFNRHPDARMRKAFKAVFSAQRREYGKVLMGTGQPAQARIQFLLSLTHSCNPKSLMKSMALLFLTYVPNRFQPKWPSEWKVSHSRPC